MIYVVFFLLIAVNVVQGVFLIVYHYREKNKPQEPVGLGTQWWETLRKEIRDCPSLSQESALLNATVFRELLASHQAVAEAIKDFLHVAAHETSITLPFPGLLVSRPNIPPLTVIEGVPVYDSDFDGPHDLREVLKSRLRFLDEYRLIGKVVGQVPPEHPPAQ